MNTFIKTTILSALCAFSLNSTFAQDAVLDAAQAAREASWKGAASYGDALFNTGEANGVLVRLNGISETSSIEFGNLNTRAGYLKIEKDSLDQGLKILDENFIQNKNFLHSVLVNLEAAKKVVPMGEKLMENGDKIAEQLSDIAAKNTGKNYVDKNYAERVIAIWSDAKRSYKDTEKAFQKNCVNISIASPRLAGISNMSVLSSDFFKKASMLALQNEAELKSYQDAVNSLLQQSVASQKGLTERMQKLRDLKNEYTLAHLDLSAFISNELPQNEKYKDFVFKPNLETLNKINRIGYTFGGGAKEIRANVMRAPVMEACAMAPEAKYSANVMRNAAMDATTPAGSLQKAKSASGWGSNVANIEEKPKDVRDEILSLTSKLIGLACQIEINRNLLYTINCEADSAVVAINETENATQNILREAIDFSGRVQVLNSDIAIFKSKLDVAAAQSKISVEQIAQLCEKADANIDECRASTELIAENLKLARDGLK